MEQLMQSCGSVPGNVLQRALVSESSARRKFPSGTNGCWTGWIGSLLALLFILGSHTTGFAQQGSNAGLTGTVSDKSGAAVGAAQVVATNQATNVIYKVTATGSGVYSIPSLPPGTYNVSATKQGFNKAVVENVTFHVGELLNVDLKLDIGSVTDTVTVSSDTQLMETASTQINYIIGEKELQDWPISATAGSPGGERDISEYIYNNLPGATGVSFVGSINGGQTKSNEIYYEGVPLGTMDTAEEGGSVDAVREVNMQVGVMNAQYNGGGTAVTNVGLKSGTNDYHGKVVSILQNEDLNANGYAAIQAGQPRAQDRYLLFSGSLGGPVRIPKLYNGRDKTFFFANFERDDQSNLGLGGGNANMPTQAMMNGDFSAWLNPALTQNATTGAVATQDILGRNVVWGQIYNPATTRTLNKGQIDPVTGRTANANGFVRDPYVNNQIPTGQFDSVAANVLKLNFPTNYLGSQVIGNIPTAANPQPELTQYFFTVKGDQVLTPNQKISLLYEYNNRSIPQKDATWSVGHASSVLDDGYNQLIRSQVARANHYWTITPTISNHFGVGYFVVPISFASVAPSQNWASALGIPNFSQNGFPTISFSGSGSLGGSTSTLGTSGSNEGQLRDNSDYMLIDQVYVAHGAHQLQAGFEARFYISNWTNPTTPGTFSFSSAMTDDGTSTSNYAGNALASFLLGQLNSISSTLYTGAQHYRRHEEGLYFQDDWKVTPRLTLNLGIRWELVGSLYETNGEWSGVDLSVPNTAAGGLPGALVFASQSKKKTFENSDFAVILPRVGFAYNPNPRMVFRAGFGVNSQAPVYSAEPFEGTALPSTTGYSTSIALNSTTNPQAYSGIAVGKLSAPYPAPPVSLPNYDPTQANLQSVSVNNPRGSRPMTFANYTAGIQVDLGHGVIGQINYVGNVARRIRQSALTQLNQLPIGALATYGDSLLDNITLHPTIPKPYPGFTGTVEQALAPIPQYKGGGVSFFDSGSGYSRYDALQATLTKRMTRDLSFFINYTWSKTLTNTNGGVQDVANLKAEKAVASFIHVPQIAKVTTIYALPLGKGEMVNLHGPLDWVLGGWRLAGNAIYQSGDTLGITDSFVANGIFATTRPNFTGQPVKLNQKGFIDTVHNTGPFYLNPAAFTHVPFTSNHKVALTTGNVPSILPGIQGPGYAFENLGIMKGFGLGEQRRLEIRADAFNVLNRAGRGDPSTNINDPNFGRILSTQSSSSARENFTPRTLQLQGSFSF
jgi:hypothetical protein